MRGDDGVNEGGGAKLDAEKEPIDQHRRKKDSDERLGVMEDCEHCPITADVPHVGDGGNDLDGEEEEEESAEDARVVRPCL